MKNRLLGIWEAMLIALVILSGSIALPIVLRPFYYLHIGPMDLAQTAGLTVQQVKTAYNEMMDFCMGLTDTFSVGVLPFSQEGAAHFRDVRKLFVLDLWVFSISTILLTGTVIVARKQKLRLLGHTTGFWSAVGLGVIFVTVGALAAIDFDKVFTVFHTLFFPGKTNWLFNPKTDPVILLLPWEFFRNCGVLILGSILTACGSLLLHDRRARRK